MKQVFFNSSQLPEVHDVEEPSCGEKEILVSVRNSLISSGTETVGYNSGSMFSRGFRNPSTIKKVTDTIKQLGVRSTYKKIKEKKNELLMRGYSGSGIVVSVGEKVQGFSVGDYVAYAGAPHAELIIVNENLTAHIPDKVSFPEAAFGALGCISMHGVRLGEPSLGEVCVVVGLGLVGLLTAQLARASGLKVICIEPDKYRREVAQNLGFKDIIDPAIEDDLPKLLYFFSDGLGIDIMYLCAGVKSSHVTNEAISCCRDKGRVIMIGDMGLNLDRGNLFQKEIDFKVSRSYGPGRYDENYEVKGLDYPIGYVRWTEQRNLSHFLNMVQNKSISLNEMVTGEYLIEDAPKAYQLLIEKKNKNLAILLSYNQSDASQIHTEASSPQFKVTKIKNNELRIGIIGCGSFVQSNLLPHFSSLGVSLYGVSNRTIKEFSKINATYNPTVLTTNTGKLIEDPNVDAFIIATQHNSHAHLAKKILNQQKPVYVEKPLALSLSDAQEIAQIVQEKSGLLSIGYNRRCSPYTKTMKEYLKSTPEKRQFLYRINAPVLPQNHWLLDPEIGGGRLIGEGCHFIDLICYLADSKIIKVSGSFLGSDSKLLKAKDNFTITLSFANGDIGTVVYSGQGNTNLSKELIEVYTAGRVFVIDDFKKLSVYGMDVKDVKGKQEKGFKQHLGSFFNAVRGKSKLITTVSDGLRVAKVIEQLIYNQKNN